jgi:hypothetical protein
MVAVVVSPELAEEALAFNSSFNSKSTGVYESLTMD